MNKYSKEKLLHYFSEFVTAHKNNLFHKIKKNRTRYLTVALENIFQPHNASAVLRTCDCFGIQDVHIIENTNPYTISKDVALGASKWLNLYKYNKQEQNTLDTIEHLRSNAYRIIATTPHVGDVNLEDFDINKGKFALFFGTEQTGLSNVVLNEADEFLKIPMYGFTESFNISVSAAIVLHYFTWRLHKSSLNWQLTESEQTDLLLQWYRVHIKDAENMESRFLEQWQ